MSTSKKVSLAFINIMSIAYGIYFCLFIRDLKSPLKTIQPWDFVFCQMKDEVVWDYWIWRVQYTSEDWFVLRWGHVPLIPANNEYWLHEPFKDWLSFSSVECYRPLYN